METCIFMAVHIVKPALIALTVLSTITATIIIIKGA